MENDTRQESGPEREERCRDREHWHKHHHRRDREWNGGTTMGPLWCIGWLFTIGYLHMPFFWKGVLALIIWPYYLGRALVQ
jgi:hypothetical protein